MARHEIHPQTGESPEVQPVGRLRRLAHFLVSRVEELVIGEPLRSDLRVSLAGSSGDFRGLNAREKKRAKRLFADKPSQPTRQN